jgi:hypothetical protein
LLVLATVFVVMIVLKTHEPSEKKSVNIPTANALVTTRVRVVRDCYWHYTKGWNQFSFCVNRTNHTVRDVFSEIEGDYRFVLRWNASTQNFDVYSPLSSNNPFDELTPNESFFVMYLPEEEYTQESEYYFEDVAVPLEQSWNAVPYPFEFPANFTTIDPYLGDYRFILKWNATNQAFDVYSPRSSQNTVNSVGAGEGYMLYLNAPHVLVYYKSMYPR